jgi:glycosyltransferase involved in cell wall biosynthesis
MKIGYISSNVYRHTFEINEVVELCRQKPGTRVYSFYRPVAANIQTRRIGEVPVDIGSWSLGSIVRGFAYLLARKPLRLMGAGFELALRSLPNPVYWFKNKAAFFIAMPMLEDAHRHGVTHLHANFGSSPATIAWLGKKVLGTSMSVTFHAFDIYVDELRFRDPLKRRKLRDAEMVVAVHHDGLEHLKRLVPDVATPPGKFRVIRISVVFEPEPGAASGEGEPLLVAAGNLIPKKGFDVLLRAVASLRRDGLVVRARILGEGPERGRLESIARSEGIDDRVELPGYYQHHQLAGHLAQASALVMPSRVVPGGQRDGIPTVVVEAWLARTPVIASLVGGMAEVIEDGRTGLVFAADDWKGLASCVRRLLGPDQLRTALADEGHRLAVASFSPKRNVEEFVKAVESLVGSRR